jgi:hypothetical protein
VSHQEIKRIDGRCTGSGEGSRKGNSCCARLANSLPASSRVLLRTHGAISSRVTKEQEKLGSEHQRSAARRAHSRPRWYWLGSDGLLGVRYLPSLKSPDKWKMGGQSSNWPVTRLVFRYSLAQLLDIGWFGEVVIEARFFETVVICFSTITGNGD